MTGLLNPFPTPFFFLMSTPSVLSPCRECGAKRVDPKSSEIGHFFRTILVLCLGHGIFHPICVAVLFFSRSAVALLREVLSSQIEG